MDRLYTEKEIAKATRYSRVTLQTLRLGKQRRHGEKVYHIAPVLVKNVDWFQYGRSVLYTDAGVKAIKKHTALSKRK